MHQQSLALKVTETFVDPSTAANATWKPEAGLADGFLVKEDGIYKHYGDPSEDSEPQRICSPLRVLGQCRDPQGKRWGRLISVQDADGRWHESVVEARLVQKRATSALDPLFALGLQLGDVEKADKAVIGMIASWRTEQRYERKDRLGWLGGGFDAFALGTGRVIGKQKIILAGASQAMDGALKPRGTMEHWRRDIAEPCAGNPLMVLALSTAFSGPLLSMLGAEGGGFHFRGPSSCGKSTLLRIAVSVWGAPDFKQSWRGTDNGIEGIAAACNNTLLALDELHEVEPNVAGEIVYMLANGRGKARMDRGSQADARQRWSVPVLSSGELSLEAHMQSARRKATAGQEVRLIDLAGGERRFGAFDTLHGSTSGQVFADRMQEASSTSYGVAGAEFVEYLISEREKARDWQKLVDRFCQICVRNLDLPPDGQVQQILRKFAVAGLAGKLATTAGLTGWGKHEAWLAAHNLFASWYEARDGETAAALRETIARTQSYLTANRERFSLLGTTEAAQDGWRDQDWFYIKPDCWSVIHDGFDPRRAARHHKAEGLLRTGEGLQYRMGRAVPDRPRVYAVRATVLQ